MKTAIPTGFRRGAPRVGDTVLVDIAGDPLRTIVTQVLVRRVVSGGIAADWHAIKTAALGVSSFRRGIPNYVIEEN